MNKRLELINESLESADIKINGTRPFDIQVGLNDLLNIEPTTLSLGESYVDGLWDSNDLRLTLHKLIINQDAIVEKLKRFENVIFAPQYIKSKLFNLQTKDMAKQSIGYHYDIGNELYTKMLDKNMAYSCAYWKNSKTLEDAQKAKFDLICKKIGLKRGNSILDIGCGFGTFAKYAATKYGASVLGVTLSEEQKKYADSIIGDSSVEIQLKDYRDLTGQFDHIISIGMFEHVGPKNYDEFFEKVSSLLKDDGLFLLHTIGASATSTVGDPWIDKYIFMGGVLPSMSHITTATEGRFVIEDWHNFGYDYHLTLEEWFKRFDANWEEIRKSNPNLYTDKFYRVWKYYLLSCSAIFSSRRNNLWQIVLSKNGVKGGYNRVC